MIMKKHPYNFDVIFQKIGELKDSNEEIISSEELLESQEINRLREIIADISEKQEEYFSTA